MKHVFLNLRALVRREKFIFLILLLCVFVSSMVLNFSYGLYYNYEREKQQNIVEYRELWLEINKEQAPTHRQVQDFVEALSPETTENVFFFISGTLSYYASEHSGYLENRFTYVDGQYGVPAIVRENVEKELISGRMISDAEEANGDYVAVVYNGGSGWDEITASLGDGESYVELWGDRFQVVGECPLFVTPIVPFLTVPDNFVYDDLIVIQSDKVFTRSMYEDLKHNAQVYMPDAVTFPELEFVDTDIIQLYNTLVFLSLLICLLSALNLAALYHYILEKRIRSLLVMRICGATKRRTVWLYLAECLCISIPIYFAGTAFYMLMLKTMLGSIFDYIEEAYSWKVYGLIFLAYLVVLSLVMLIMLGTQVKRNIMTQWKEAAK